MAEITSAVSTQLAFDARRALSILSRARITSAARPGPDGVLPDGLEARRQTGDVVLNIRDGATALGRALTAGFGILSALQGLRGNVRLAINDALVSPDTGLRLQSGAVLVTTTNSTLPGTRVSRLNISAQLGRAIAAIDELVEASGFRGANLISSDGRRVTIQTTAFGGRLSVAPQPLDSVGLGLEDLSTVTRADAEEALARIASAVVTAEGRIDDLEALQRSLGFAGGTSQSFARVVNNGLTSALPRGSLVNLVA